MAALLAVFFGLCGCAGRAAPPAPTAATRAPASVSPQRDWQDAILYFVLLDRFADGDEGNNRAVDRSARASPPRYSAGTKPEAVLVGENWTDTRTIAPGFAPVPHPTEWAPSDSPPGCGAAARRALPWPWTR